VDTLLLGGGALYHTFRTDHCPTTVSEGSQANAKDTIAVCTDHIGLTLINYLNRKNPMADNAHRDQVRKIANAFIAAWQQLLPLENAPRTQ
jgi:hypothetical protein